MRNLPIPDRFKLAGLTFRVIKDPAFGEKQNLAGHCVHTKQLVIVDTGCNHQQSQEQACLHEQIHAILTIMGRHDLNEDEAFVDMLAHLLYQALTSAEFDEEEEVCEFVDIPPDAWENASHEASQTPSGEKENKE